MEQIEDIFLEIGLSGYTSLENDDLSWDNNANGIPTEQLKWYYGKPRSSQPNCLAADSCKFPGQGFFKKKSKNRGDKIYISPQLSSLNEVKNSEFSSIFLVPIPS